MGNSKKSIQKSEMVKIISRQLTLASKFLNEGNIRRSRIVTKLALKAIKTTL